MILHFRGGNTSNNLSIIKETREVQNGTYHNVIKGMSLEL